MLCLSRKIGERITIADNIEVVIVGLQEGRVKVGIEAPKEIKVLRGELKQENGNVDVPKS